MHYLDTSVVLSLFFPEVHSAAAQALVNETGDLAVSLWVGVELESVLNRKRRTEALDAQLDQEVRDAYEGLALGGRVAVLALDAAVYRRAAALLRGDAPLRSADALHLAVADLNGAAIATCDHQLARAAEHHDVRCRFL